MTTNQAAKKITVLFARADSVYKTLPGTDVFDIKRDARSWNGKGPLIAHPPCRAWGRLRTFAKPRAGEKELALWSVAMVRSNGGIIEHPVTSKLWPAANLPPPGKTDEHGGFTFPLHQHSFGHRAEKATLLYIVGIEPRDLPPIPWTLTKPTHVIQSRKRRDHRPHTSKAEREHTPEPFARWLLETARRIPSKEFTE